MPDGGKPALLLFSERMLPFVAPLADSFDIVRAWEASEAISEQGSKIIALLTVGTDRIDEALLDRLPNIRLIVAVGAGYQGVDIAAARVRGIRVANAGDTHSGDVADHAVALTLGSLQRLQEMDGWVRQDRWRVEPIPPRRRALSAERFGIVGLGFIGTAIGHRLEPFGGEVGWWGPRPKSDARWTRHDSLLALAEWCTTLIVAVRGDPANARLIDRAVIDAVGPEGLIVNVARGFVIDEDALIAALRNGRIGRAALDVFEEEPTPPARWEGVPNTLLSPHAATITREAIQRLQDAAARNLRSVLTGEPVVHEICA